jgi:predicted acylesterase/phospholipase RssA
VADRPSNLCLALSGGGFRAALYHLGVIRFLYKTGMLREVKYICSVSGGSVLAAHLLLNWHLYTGDENSFQNAAERLVAFAQSDMRGAIVRRLLLRFGLLVFVLSVAFAAGVWLASAAGANFVARLMPWMPSWAPLPGLAVAWVGATTFMVWWWRNRGRTFLLRQHYEAFYRPKAKALPGWKKWFAKREKPQLTDLGGPEQGKPQLYILATSLTTTEVFAFKQTGLDWNDPKPDEEPDIAGSHLPVSTAVAASSAFPPFFPPVTLTPADLKSTSAKFDTQRLTDGGVHDNLGLSWARKLPVEKSSPVEILIVSDAEAELDEEKDASYRWDLQRNLRASYILMQRLSGMGRNPEVQREKGGAPNEEDKKDQAEIKRNPEAQHKACSFCIRDVVRRAGTHSVPVETQRQIQFIRTDFDNFSNGEVHLLIAHGYATARQAWKEMFPIEEVPVGDPWSPITDEELLNDVKRNKIDLSQSKKTIRLRWPGWRTLIWAAPIFLGAGLVILGCFLLCARGGRPHGLDCSGRFYNVTYTTADDPLFKNTRVLDPLVPFWEQQMKEQDKAYKIVKLEIAPDADSRASGATGPFPCGLVYDHTAYRFTAHAFTARESNAGPVCDEYLPIVAGTDDDSFEVPALDSRHSLVIIGRLVRRSPGDFPDDPCQILSPRVK